MKQFFCVGNYSEKGINFLTFDINMKVDEICQLNDSNNNSYLCKLNNNLYSVVEIQEKDKTENGYVNSYKIENNKIIFINRKTSYGKGACFLNIDSLRNILYIGNYVDGSVVAFKIENDGRIGDKIYYKKLTDTSNIHCIKFSYDFKKIYIVDLGEDSITEYSIFYDGKILDLIEKNVLKLKNGSQPRHIVLDNKDNIYVVTEYSCELYKISHNQKEELIILEQKSILPENTVKKLNDTGCAIIINSKMDKIYVSIRGNNSISVFNIKNDKMELIQNISCYGDCPRDICFDSKEEYLMCANQNSNDISIFKNENGVLLYKSKYEVESPSCILFV